MSNRPTVSAHVEALRKRLRQRYWILFHLKRYGFSESDLCKVYRNIIRPVADYCCKVYHPMLTDEQDESGPLPSPRIALYFWKRLIL